MLLIDCVYSFVYDNFAEVEMDTPKGLFAFAAPLLLLNIGIYKGILDEQESLETGFYDRPQASYGIP